MRHKLQDEGHLVASAEHLTVLAVVDHQSDSLSQLILRRRLLGREYIESEEAAG